MRALDVLINIDADGFLRRLDKSISALYPDHPFGSGVEREGFGEDIRHAVLGNLETIISFRVGEDAP